MKLATYTRYEVLRTFRNVRFFIFSLIFPLVMLVLIAAPNRHARVGGIALPLYFMAGMTAFGTMMAVVSSGGRIAVERQVGWNRQLRLTPLRPSTYLMTKVLCGYAMAAVSMLLIFTVGLSLGVRLSGSGWLTLTLLVLVGLIPFAPLGIAMGHLVSVDSLGPALGGLTSILAMLGGAWGPLASGGVFKSICEGLPSYWLVQAGHTALGGRTWPVKGWIVIAVWSVLLARLAAWAYRRDTGKA